MATRKLKKIVAGEGEVLEKRRKNAKKAERAENFEQDCLTCDDEIPDSHPDIKYVIPKESDFDDCTSDGEIYIRCPRCWKVLHAKLNLRKTFYMPE